MKRYSRHHLCHHLPVNSNHCLYNSSDLTFPLKGMNGKRDKSFYITQFIYCISSCIPTHTKNPCSVTKIEVTNNFPNFQLTLPNLKTAVTFATMYYSF